MNVIPQPIWNKTSVPATGFTIQPQVGRVITVQTGFGFDGFGGGGFGGVNIVGTSIQPVWTQVQSQFGPYGVGTYGERMYGIGETYWTPQSTT